MPPLDLSQILRERLERLHGKDAILWLYEIQTPEDPPRRIRVTSNSEDVQFGTDPVSGDPVTYRHADVRHKGIEQNREGDQSEIEIQVGAQAFGLYSLFDQYAGFDDQPVEIILVSALELGNPAAAVRFPGRVLRAEMAGTREATIAFRIAAHNLYSSFLPPFRYTAHRCAWVQFGGPECGYVIPNSPTNQVGGGFDFCPKSLEACTERGDDEEARGLTRQHPLRMRIFRGARRGN